MLTQGLGYFMFVDPRKPLMCPKLKNSTVDPKFQSNLVSRTGAEVYPYPSPLHAVALQSPIFSVGGEPTIPRLLEGQGPPTNSAAALQKSQIGNGTMTQTYIDRLLVRSFDKVKTDTGPEDVQTHNECQRNLAKVVTIVPEVPQRDKSVVQPHSVQTTSSSLDNSQKRNCMTYSSQERADNANIKQPVKVPDASFRYSYPARSRDCTPEETTISSMRKKDKSKGEFPLAVNNNSENKCVDKPESRLQTRSGSRPKIVMGHSSSTKESQCLEGKGGHTTSPDFVHAEFVPAGSHSVKVRQADHKTNAVKLRRKSNEKPRAVRQQHGYSSGEKAREAVGGSKGEQRRASKGKVIQKFACYAEDQRQGSGSESSHSSPGLMYTHKAPPKTHPTPVVTKSSKNRRILSLDHEQPLEQRKKRQESSDVEMFDISCSQNNRSRGPQAQGSMQTVHMYARSGQWMGPPGSFQTPVSPHSFLHNLNARYLPSPFHMSSHYPPRCESEYSAECASLFHSTIAESSEGEMSDNTTNRFGDGESSQSFLSFSDSESSLSPDEDYQVYNQGEERDLVWAKDSLSPTAAGLQHLPPCPEPSSCRIKASRALKKKIRRFQPASLKVMTLV